MTSTESAKAPGHNVFHDGEGGFLRTVLDALNYLFYVVDVTSYAILLANRAATKQFGANSPNCYAIDHRRETP